MTATIIVEGEPVGNTTTTAITRDEPDPPSISFAKAAIFAGILIALVFGAGYAMRRPNRASDEPVAPAAPEGPGD
jgi:hypothetical protein